jgi:hypothetical protein
MTGKKFEHMSSIFIIFIERPHFTENFIKFFQDKSAEIQTEGLPQE